MQAVYTGLFNACANSPFPEDGRMRAHNLLMHLREAGYVFQSKLYAVCLKSLTSGFSGRVVGTSGQMGTTRCKVFFLPRAALAASEAAYLSHHAILVISHCGRPAGGGLICVFQVSSNTITNLKLQQTEHLQHWPRACCFDADKRPCLILKVNS